jgi:hypothetical protein
MWYHLQRFVGEIELVVMGDARHMCYLLLLPLLHTHTTNPFMIYTTCTHNIIIIQRRTYITHTNMLFLFLSYIFYSPLLIGSGAWKLAAVRRMVGLIERFEVSK